MPQPASSGQPDAPALTLGHLEASYPMYCKALLMLIREGNSLNRIKRTLCWQRLELLHTTLPRQYRDPVVHYGMLKRSVAAELAKAAAAAAQPE